MSDANIGLIARVYPKGVFGIFDANDGFGGWHAVNSVADLDDIPGGENGRRDEGMAALVRESGNIYTLGADLETWTLAIPGDLVQQLSDIADDAALALTLAKQGYYGWAYGTARPNCSTVATSNVTPSGVGQTINGWTVGPNEWLLLSGQTEPIENGPWATASGAWERPFWWSSDSYYAIAQPGTIVHIDGGDYAGTDWRCTSPLTHTIIVDTTPTAWAMAPTGGILIPGATHIGDFTVGSNELAYGDASDGALAATLPSKTVAEATAKLQGGRAVVCAVKKIDDSANHITVAAGADTELEDGIGDLAFPGQILLVIYDVGASTYRELVDAPPLATLLGAVVDIIESFGFVPDSRSINTAGPLQGGGPLDGDLDLSITEADDGVDGYMPGAAMTEFLALPAASTLSALAAWGYNSGTAGDLDDGAISNVKVVTNTAWVDGGNTGAALSLDYADGQRHKVTVDDDTTITLDFPGAGSFQLWLSQDGDGGHSVDFGAGALSIVWPQGELSTSEDSGDHMRVVTFVVDPDAALVMAQYTDAVAPP